MLIYVFDSDQHIPEMISRYCSEAEIRLIDNVDSCFRRLSEPEELPDYILVDWFYKGSVSGPGIINRLKQGTYTSLVPILILSGFHRTPINLVEEFFCMRILPKPIAETSFSQTIEEIKLERLWYLKNYPKIQSLINKRSLDQSQIVNKFLLILEDSPHPGPLGMLVSDQFYGKGDFKSTETILKKLLSLNSENIDALSKLGKIYCQTNRQQEAYRLTKKADFLSPHNLERISILGKMELKNADCPAAQSAFKRVLDLDDQNRDAHLGLKLAESLSEHSSRKAVNLSLSYAGLLNMMGISKIHKGQIGDGIIHYKSALDFLNSPILRSKVMFNIGLGYLRNKDFDMAQKWFKSSAEAGSSIFAKGAIYFEKLDRYLADTGKSMASNDLDDLDLENDELDSEILDVSSL